MVVGTEVQRNVRDELREKKSTEFGFPSGESTHEILVVVKGTYSAGEQVTEEQLWLARSKLLLEMKKRSCAILAELRVTMERNMALLRQERRELLRNSSVAYRQRLRRRA